MATAPNDPEVDALLVEQRRRWEERAPLRVEELLRDHPVLQGQKDALLDLINHEIVLRCEFDTMPTRDEYLARFPDLKSDLDMLFEVQEAIEADTSQQEFVERGGATSAAGRNSSGDTDYNTIAHHAAAALTRDVPSLSNYRVLDKLGQGGMGVVYKALDLRLKRTVALKMIRAADAGLEERRRFQIEAEAVAKLDHPGIVHIFDIGEQADQPYFALEYVDGGSLAELLQGAPQPPQASARLIELLARAVHYAHVLGIIHRDLKPANILLHKVGDSPSQLGDAAYWVHGGKAYLPKITDFGLAKHVQNNSDATQTHAIIGTPSYMAPEQAGDFKRRIGAAADVYSLGAILYELIAGRPPFRGETVLDTLDQLRTQEPVSPRRLQPRAPRDLETICLKCLRKDPVQRYASAEELANDLARFLRHEPIRARPPSALQYVRLWCQRRPAVASLLALLAILIGSSLVSLALLWRWAAAGEELGKAQFYDSRINIAQRHWRETQVNRMTWLLERLKPAAGDKDRREFEWYYLHGLLNQDLARVSADRGLAYNRDGSLLAAGLKHEIHLWKSADLEANRDAPPIAKLLGHTGDIVSIAFGPKGDLLLSGAADRTVRLWDVAKREPLKILLTHPADVTAVACSPTGGAMASACRDGIIRLWDPDGKLRFQLTEHAAAVNDVVFSADGRRLISGGSDNRVIIWDAATGMVLRKLQGHADVLTVAVSPNEQYVASSGVDREVRLWDLENGSLLHKFAPLPRTVTRLAFRADSQRLACACEDGAIRIWTTVPAKKEFADDSMFYTDPIVILKGHLNAVEDLAFAPSGERLASLSKDHTLRLWNPNREQEARSFDLPMVASRLALNPRATWVAVAGQDKDIHLWNWQTGAHKVLSGHPGAPTAVAFAGDGTLASAGADGKVRIWDIEEGRIVRELPGAGVPVFTMDFHPGAHRLATANDDGAVRFWDAAGGHELHHGPTHKGPVHHVLFDPSGRQLASAGTNGKDTKDGTISVCDSDTGREVFRLSDPYRTPRVLAFSADGRFLAAGDEQFTIRIWDMKTHQRLLQLEGHEGPVLALAFSHNGHRLASASKDGAVKVWDLETGLELLTLRGFTREANGVFFVQEDTKLLALGQAPMAPAQLRVWDATPGGK